MAEAVRLSASMLDLRALYYFVHVAEGRSFSRAAASLSVSQPVLSRFIKQLEVMTRVQLLYRNGRGVGLTEAGELLYDHGLQILRNLSQAHLEVAALRGTSIGTVSIALPPLLGGTLTAELIRRIHADHPLVRIVLREGFTAEALDWLGAGHVDIGLMFNPPHIATLIAEHVCDDCIHLVGTPGSLDLVPGSPVSVKQVAALPLIVPPAPHRLRNLIDTAAHEAGAALNISVEVTGTSSILELVRKRVGYTILPSVLLRDELREARLSSWPIVDPMMSTRLFAATSMQRPQSLAVKSVLSAITAILGAALKQAP